ncbi:MAG: glycerophosphoryl diester phosphodiesterase [Pseudonocardiales bacterium]|jgi:glycerophosphoryl diester phosphodiesterase|nr:glycerophosphoryl diester phosphodiesterase [Pseudonocardiales bacterium]
MRHPAPRVVAHRGASADRPEHTLAAYVLALEQGADGLECDVRLTRDGHLVCIHDRRIDRTSTGSGPVSAYDLAALSVHDFGAWRDELDVDGVIEPSSQGRPHVGVLTLDELLTSLADWPDRVQLFIETKHPAPQGGLVEATLVRMLREHGLATPKSRADSRVVIMSFSAKALRRVRAEAPELPTVALLPTLSAVRSGELPPWADFAGPRFGALKADPGFVLRAAAHGHLTYCWTVDEPADVALCAEFGVDYLATNSPGAARSQLRCW